MLMTIVSYCIISTLTVNYNLLIILLLPKLTGQKKGQTIYSQEADTVMLIVSGVLLINCALALNPEHIYGHLGS